MRHISLKWRFARLALGALSIGLSPVASPTAIAQAIFDGHNTCSGINCESLSIRGTIFTYRDSGGTPTDRLPWSAMVYADQGECLRLDVVDETADLLMTVADPRGAVYREDDPIGGCPKCPIVKIDPALSSGWYSVVLRPPVSGIAEVTFQLRIGRYNSGNPNCATPSTAF